MEHAHTRARTLGAKLTVAPSTYRCPNPCFVHYRKTVRLVYVSVTGVGTGVPLTLKLFIQCIDVNPRLPS